MPSLLATFAVCWVAERRLVGRLPAFGMPDGLDFRERRDPVEIPV